MGQVILSLEEYEELKKKADAGEIARDVANSYRDIFKLYKSYGDDKIVLEIKVKKAAEILKSMIVESEFNDGTYEVEVDENNLDYGANVAEYYVKAVKKQDKVTEELAEEEDTSHGN